jgi:hypothetical protein
MVINLKPYINDLRLNVRISFQGNYIKIFLRIPSKVLDVLFYPDFYRSTCKEKKLGLLHPPEDLQIKIAIQDHKLLADSLGREILE